MLVFLTGFVNYCPPPLPQPKEGGGGGTHSPAGEGVGESQFGRLEKKPSTLSVLRSTPNLRKTMKYFMSNASLRGSAYYGILRERCWK